MYTEGCGSPIGDAGETESGSSIGDAEEEQTMSSDVADILDALQWYCSQHSCGEKGERCFSPDRHKCHRFFKRDWACTCNCHSDVDGRWVPIEAYIPIE